MCRLGIGHRKVAGKYPLVIPLTLLTPPLTLLTLLMPSLLTRPMHHCTGEALGAASGRHFGGKGGTQLHLRKQPYLPLAPLSRCGKWVWPKHYIFTCASSHRADAFCAKDCRGLAEWFQEIGLDMYTDLAEEKIGSGEKLVELISEGSNHPLVVRQEGCHIMCVYVHAYNI